jgi:hypothetical protein
LKKYPSTSSLIGSLDIYIFYLDFSLAKEESEDDPLESAQDVEKLLESDERSLFGFGN